MKGFAKAQAAYEAQLPPEYGDDEFECDHSWRFLGESGGENYYVCRKCGEEACS